MRGRGGGMRLREEVSLVRIPSGDYGQHSVYAAGMLARSIRLQYSHNYYV